MSARGTWSLPMSTRRGWTWREVPADGVRMGPFTYRDMSTPLARSIGLPASKYFDPQLFLQTVKG